MIGVGADLPVTVKDAKAIEKQLVDPERCAYKKEHVKLLTEEKAHKQNVLEGLEWLSETTTENDTAIVYFSGHGIESPNYHLMPHGYNLGDISNTAISGEDFTNCLKKISARKLLVLLDCCHAGGQAEAKNFVKSPLPLNAINELSKSSGRVVLASSRKDELSWIEKDKSYSFFTKALLEALAGYGASEQDSYARILDIAMWVSRKVPDRTEDKQHPIIKVSNLEDNFAVAFYSGGDKSPHKITAWESTEFSLQSSIESQETQALRRMLINYRENYLLIQERKSEFAEFERIPLDLIRNERKIEAKIDDLENKLKDD